MTVTEPTYNPPFTLYQGSDIEIFFTIYESDGVTVEDITSWSMAANFSPVSTQNTDEDLAKAVSSGITLTDPTNGIGKIVIEAAESVEMDTGIWEWDLWRTDSGTTYPVALGTFTLEATPYSRNSDVN